MKLDVSHTHYYLVQRRQELTFCLRPPQRTAMQQSSPSFIMQNADRFLLPPPRVSHHCCATFSETGSVCVCRGITSSTPPLMLPSRLFCWGALWLSKERRNDGMMSTIASSSTRLNSNAHLRLQWQSGPLFVRAHFLGGGGQKRERKKRRAAKKLQRTFVSGGGLRLFFAPSLTAFFQVLKMPQ